MSPLITSTGIDPPNSSFEAATAIIGDKWSLLIIASAFLGMSKFDDFHRELGIARNILAARIKALIEHDLIARSKYLDKPLRFEYILTPKGQNLNEVIGSIQSWGQMWYPN